MNKRKLLLFCCLMLAVGLVGLRPVAWQQAAVAQAYPYQAGFPRADARSTIAFGSPTVVDINNDGQLNVLLPDGHGCVWAWDHTGQVLPNFPLKTAGSCQGTPRINGPLAVGDVDGDGRLEIAAGTRGAGTGQGQRGRIFVWNDDGSLLSGWPREMAWNMQFGSGQPEVMTVAMANITGDARLEVIAGTSNNSSNGGTPDDATHNLYAFHANGTALPGFPTKYRRAGIWGFVAAADLDGDGYAEIITGRDHAFIHAYNRQGNQLPNWPQESPVDLNLPQGLFMEFTRDAPSIADLDGDGILDIVIAGKVRDPALNRLVTHSAVLVLQPNGQRKSGWHIAKLGGAPIASGDFPTQAPALADLNGDGKLEIVVAMLDGRIRAYQADGSLLWQYNFAQGAHLFASEPVIGDVTGNGRPDIIFGTYSPDGSANHLARLHGLDNAGAPLPNFPLPLTHEGNAQKQGLRAAPTLADLDNDCDVEILAASQATILYVWDLPAPYHAARMPWPTARHNFQRTGFVQSTAVSGAVNGNILPYNNQEGAEEQIFLPLIANQANLNCR